jgi:hypothetical protein
MGARGQAQASAAQQQGQREAIQAQLAMFNQARADQLPLIQARNAALPLFMQLLGLNPAGMNFGTPGAGGVQMNVTGQKPGQSLSSALRDTHWLGGSNVREHRSMFWNPLEAPSHTRDTLRGDLGIWFGDTTHPDAGEATFTYDQEGNVVGANQGGYILGQGGRLIPRRASGQSPSTPSTPTTPAAPIDINALIASTPGYQFRLNQGLQGVERSAAARGGLTSGATLRALQRYGEGAAAQEFGDFANRLASLIGLGQTAATTAGGFGQQTGANIGQNLANIGASRGSSYANQANMWGQGIGGAANAFANYWANRPQTTQTGNP